MQKLVAQFTGKRVLVIGDLMVDLHIQATPSRFCPEASELQILSQERLTRYPGGAANVAMNCQALGASVTLIGAAGRDPQGQWLHDTLMRKGIRCPWPGRVAGNRSPQTTTKLRIYVGDSLTCRVDHDQYQELVAEDLVQRISEWEGFDLLLLSDYQKGALSGVLDPVLRAFQKCSPGGVVAANPKPELARELPQDIDLVSFNQYEWQRFRELAELDLDTYVELRESEALHRLRTRYLLVTAGEQGLTLHRKYLPKAYTSPGRPVRRPDVVGAGDAVFAAAGLALTVTKELAPIANIANAAGILKVQKSGTSPVRSSELESFLAHQSYGGNLRV